MELGGESVIGLRIRSDLEQETFVCSPAKAGDREGGIIWSFPVFKTQVTQGNQTFNCLVAMFLEQSRVYLYVQ